MLKFLFQKKFFFPATIVFLAVISGSSLGYFLKNKEAFLTRLNKIQRVFAQEIEKVELQTAPYLFSRFPQRLIYLLEEGNELSKEIVELNEELKGYLENCNCKNAISQCVPFIGKCVPGEVLGSSCTELTKINQVKEDIDDKIDNLSLVREILKEEMASGLEESGLEFETLREELVDEIKKTVNDFLTESENLIENAKKNKELYSTDYTPLNCKAQCKPGPVCGIKACIMVATGPQKNIAINVKVGIRLEDIDLGKVGIKKFGLALPEKINFPKLGDLVFSIPPQTLSVCFPFGSVPITIQPPSFESLPTLSFGCPSLPSLKIPEIPTLKLPREFRIPSFEIPLIKWCPEIPEVPGFELEKIKQEMVSNVQNEVDRFKSEIDKAVNEIEKNLKNAPESVKKDLNDFRKNLLNEYQNVANEIPKKAETPQINFEKSGPSMDYQYRPPQSQGLETKEFSLSYQCSQTSGDSTVKTTPLTNWYFETLSYLMERCAEIPTMSNYWGLTNKAEGCFDQNKVVETTLNECDSLWEDYCQSLGSNQEGGSFQTQPEPPEFCKKIRYSCEEIGQIPKEKRGEISAAIQCQALFKQEKLSIPEECKFAPAIVYVDELGNKTYSCPFGFPILKADVCVKKNFDPISKLEGKCEELKKDKERKLIEEKEERNEKGKLTAVHTQSLIEPCLLLPLFNKHIAEPGTENHISSGTKCSAQSLLNLPFGFGGGVGFSCPIGIPTLPKIVLPDIIIPDIILPSFSVPPFFRVKLPSLIIEDIILPDIELCDLNKCANLFPNLDFHQPSLNLPTLDLNIPIPQIPNLYLQGRILFPSISFSLPQINLFNLLLPELELPEISLPTPKITFSITGIDLSAIFDLIFTFILNALSIPDFGFCLVFKIPSVFLDISFPDYYISFTKFLGKYLEKISSFEIPFCQNVNEFCESIKDSLNENGFSYKVGEIENKFNGVIEEIQKELNKVTEAVEDIQNEITDVFQSVYGEAIVQAIDQELQARGTNFKNYLQTQKEKECFRVSLPEIKIALKIANKKEVKREGNQVTVSVPVDIPTEISIPWPNELKNGITLTNPITYELPKIPLSGLSFEKEFSIKGPGFQPRSFFIDFGKINEGDCNRESPEGGNPFPIVEIESKIETMKNFKSEIENSSQKIKELLE